MSKEPSILIVAEHKNVLDEVIHMVRGDFNQYYSALGDNMAVDLFEEHEPQVLLLSHESIAGAERFYLGLFRNSDKVHLTPHQSLLLCKAADSHTACESCDRGIVNDYVITRPLYDPNRLRLAVRQAISRLRIESETASMYSALSRIGGVAADLHDSLKHSIGQSDALRANTRQDYNALIAVIDAQLDDLRKRLAGHEYRDVVDVRDEAALTRRFTQFTHERVGPELEQATSRLDTSLEVWTTGLRTDYEKHAQAVGEFEELVHSIPKNVLVVDDDEMYREILRSILEPEGYKVSMASEGAQVLGTIARTRPDLILVDLEMPGLDGIEVIRRVKAHQSMRHIPVIMLTGHGEKQVVQAAIDAGAIDFMVKPTKRSVILQKVASQVGGVTRQHDSSS